MGEEIDAGAGGGAALKNHEDEELNENVGQSHDESFEQGIVVSVKEEFAFVRSPSYVDPLLFNTSDFLVDPEDGAVEYLNTHLTPGDEVYFKVGDRVDGQLRALEVRKVPLGESLAERQAEAQLNSEDQPVDPQALEGEGQYRERGIVCRLKDTNGFISRPRPYLGRLFFHFKYVRSDALGGPTKLEVGTEVSYIVCKEGNRMFAADVVVLPKGTIIQELPVEGRSKGRVIRPATAPVPEDEREDGIIGYVDEDGTDLRAFYGHAKVEDQSVALDERDEVEFSVFRQIYRKEGRAVEVKLLKKAPEKREFGKISILKSNFGFIKCCERHNDILFHFTELKDVTSDDLEIGDDVDFSVKWDLEKGKQVAIEVKKAASGAAVFEKISSELHYGIVVERLGLWKQYGSNGVVLFEGEDGNSEKLTFSANDLEDRQLNPQVGDKVSFKIATNLAQAKAAERLDGPAGKQGGRRATHVSLVKYVGRVASLVQNGSYGFIDYEHERGMSHIFFHCSEVEKGLSLKVDDIVQFVRVYNPNKQQHQARRVHRLQEAEPDVDRSGMPDSVFATDKGPDRVMSEDSGRNRFFLQHVGSGMNRTARGPDGSHGFPLGRGRSTEVPALTSQKSANLNPSAAPFIPRSLSIQSVGS